MKNRKKSEQNGVFAAIRMAAGAHPVLTAGTLLCVAGSVGASLVPPLLLARIIDRLTAGIPLTVQAVLLYFGSLALEGGLSSAQESLLVLFGQKMTHALRAEMSRKLTRLPAATLSAQNPGELAARFSGDVDTVEALFTSGVISMAADACRILSILAVIAVKNAGLALILLPVLPLDGGRALQAAVAALAGERAAERLLNVLGLVLPVALMGLGVVLFARGMGLALGAFGAWLALLQPGMTCQGGKHDVKYSYYHM